MPPTWVPLDHPRDVRPGETVRSAHEPELRYVTGDSGYLDADGVEIPWPISLGNFRSARFEVLREAPAPPWPPGGLDDPSRATTRPPPDEPIDTDRRGDSIVDLARSLLVRPVRGGRPAVPGLDLRRQLAVSADLLASLRDEARELSEAVGFTVAPMQVAALHVVAGSRRRQAIRMDRQDHASGQMTTIDTDRSEHGTA